jgi:hypothetical protein
MLMVRLELLSPQENSLVAKNKPIGTIFQWVLAKDPSDVVSNLKIAIHADTGSTPIKTFDVPITEGANRFDVSEVQPLLTDNTSYFWRIECTTSSGPLVTIWKKFFSKNIELDTPSVWPEGPASYEYIGSKTYFESLRTNAATILEALGTNDPDTSTLLTKINNDLFRGETVPSRADFLLLESVLHEVQQSKSIELGQVDELVFDDLGAEDIHKIYTYFDQVSKAKPPKPSVTITKLPGANPSIINVQFSAAGNYDGLPGTSMGMSHKEGKSTNSKDYPPTVFYDDGTYSGVLPQKGSPILFETRMEPPDDTIPVTYSAQGTSSSSSGYAPTFSYNKDGYVGTLTRTGEPVYSHQEGEPDDYFTASDSVEGTSSSSSSYSPTIPYSSGGYSGTLSRDGSPSYSRTVTGSSDTQNVTASKSITVRQGWSWNGGSSWSKDGDPEYIGDSDTYSYSSGGYVGTLSSTGITVTSSPPYPTHTQKGPIDVYFTSGSGTQSFAGKATKAGTSTDYYTQSYSGRVTKPGNIVNVYKQSYTGNATKPGTPVNYYHQLYEGATDKITKYPNWNDISWNLSSYANGTYGLGFLSDLGGIAYGKLNYKHGYSDSFYESELYFPSNALLGKVSLPNNGYKQLFEKSEEKKQREQIWVEVVDGFDNRSEAGSFTYTHQDGNFYILDDWTYEIEYLRASVDSDPHSLPPASKILQDWTPLYKGKLKSYTHVVANSTECFYYYRIRAIDASGTVTPFQNQFPAVVLK